MNRRRFSRLGALSVVPLAGCTGDGGLLADSKTPRPTEITDTEFDDDVDFDDRKLKPEISVNREDSTVTVEGLGQYGSSNCGYLDCEIEYHQEDSLLEVTVVGKQKAPEEGEPPCEDDVSGSSYRATVEFDEGVPSRIEAEHPHDTATKEIE